MNKTPESKVKIRFQDCDPFNHLNNSKYIDYFLNAREDQLSQNYDLDVFRYFRSTGKSWFVGATQIAYLKPAKVSEEVIIESALIQYSDKTLTAEMKMWDKEKKQLKSLCWMRFIHFDHQKKQACPHSDELNRLFDRVILPLAHKSFDERQHSIMREEREKADH